MGRAARNSVISIRAPPHRELACGFNGVRATKPRLFGTVEVRTPAGVPIAAAYVSLALHCNENVSYRPENRSSLTAQKQTTTTIIGKEILLWQAPDGRSHEDILSMDLPFMIPFPTSKDKLLPATLVKNTRSTTYELIATLHSTNLPPERVTIELVVEKFDQLPIWGMFTVPQVLKPPSIDHIVEMEVQLPKICYGPGDVVACTATLTGNPDWQAKVKKVRAEKLLVWIEQVVTYRLSSTDKAIGHVKTKKVAENRVDFGGLKLLDKPITQRIALPFPKPDLRDKAGLVSSNDSLVPGRAAFSTSCTLYSVEFQLHIRASFKNAKDIVAMTPIVGSRYTLTEAKVILENIESAVYEAVEIDVVTGLCAGARVVRKEDIGPGMQDRKRTVVME